MRSYSKDLQRSLELTKLAEKRWGPKRRWRCIYCGRGAGIVLDHFEPSSMGGGDDIWNLVPACDRCNASKMDFDPWGWMETAGVPLHRQAAIMRVRHLPASTTGLTVPNERYALDYARIKALKRPLQGRKGD